jgi:hypothetical protein
MSHPNHRFLVLVSAALLAPTTSAPAQFIDLLTEAPVTLQVTLQSVAATTSGASRTTSVNTTRLTNVQVLEELRAAGIIADSSITGWSLVAVRGVPSDLAYVDAGFSLYAIKGANRIIVPTSKFLAAAHASVAAYTEKNQGRYVLTSKGTVTNHVVFQYNPTFAVGSNTYAINSSESCGYAKVNFVTKDLSEEYEIFFYALSSITATTNGGYGGTQVAGSGSPAPCAGLSTLTVTVGTPKLVPASLYPAVQP